jgi:hypothetical protein
MVQVIKDCLLLQQHRLMAVKPCGGNTIFGKADKVSLDDLLMVVRKYTKTQSESNKSVGPRRNLNLIVGDCF